MAPNVKVIVPMPNESGFVRTQGTEVFIDGHKVSCITKCELMADTNSVWQVRLTLNANIEFRSDQGDLG